MRILRTLIATSMAITVSTAPAAARDWSSMYVFGDSYSDSGAGYVDGNGPTAVVYLAQELNVPFTFNGARDSEGKGLNFAVSGAQSGVGAGRYYPLHGANGPAPLIGRGLMTQVADFTHMVQDGAIKFNGNTTLFFIAGGLNDRALPTDTTVNNIENEIRQIYALGGRYFLIAILPEKIPQFASVSQRLNPALAHIPDTLKTELPGSHIALSHWGLYYDDIMINPSKYGITNTKDRCAGRAIFNENTTPCTTPDSYFFYHDGHPSAAVHRIAGMRLLGDVKAAFPDLSEQKRIIP